MVLASSFSGVGQDEEDQDVPWQVPPAPAGQEEDQEVASEIHVIGFEEVPVPLVFFGPAASGLSSIHGFKATRPTE